MTTKTLTPKTMRAIIVDDEILGRNLIRNMLAKHPQIKVVSECSNGLEAMEAIIQHNPEFIFLDIKMPGMDGIKLAEKLSPSDLRKIVFVTAHDKYAVTAFEKNAVDYLLKPFDQKRFDSTIDRLMKEYKLDRDADFANRIKEALENHDTPRPTSASQKDGENPLNNKIAVKENGRIFFLPKCEIEYFEASGNYVAIHRKGKTHLIYESLSKMESKLDPKQFIRIHRSTIINVDFIKEMEPYSNGEFIVRMTTNGVFKLSRSYRDSAKQLLNVD